MRIRRDPGIGPGGITTTSGQAGDATATAPRRSRRGHVGTAVARRFSAACSSVGQARQFLREQFVPASYDPGVEIVALMLSELATNAVQHAGTAFEVGIWVTPDPEGRSVLVRVTDEGPGFPVPQEPPADAPHGRGLRIVESLASSWGVEEQRGRSGKTVWFTARVGPGAS
jgi:anti-sigma regulatory factor (Ser/Thr protein kinase)